MLSDQKEAHRDLVTVRKLVLLTLDFVSVVLFRILDEFVSRLCFGCIHESAHRLTNATCLGISKLRQLRQ